MPGVQDDQAHAFQHPLLHAVHDVVLHLAVCDVPPPCQHVGLGQDTFGQTGKDGLDFIALFDHHPDAVIDSMAELPEIF